MCQILRIKLNIKLYIIYIIPFYCLLFVIMHNIDKNIQIYTKNIQMIYIYISFDINCNRHSYKTIQLIIYDIP